MKARGSCLHHGFGAENTRPRQNEVAFTMLLVCFGEIKTRCRQAAVAFTMIWVPITHTSPRFLWQKHTVKATGRCLHNGFGAKHTLVKARGCCLHGLAAKAHGEGSRCLHHVFGAENARRRQEAVAFTMVLVQKKLCRHRGLGRQAAVSFSMVLVPKTHGEGKRSWETLAPKRVCSETRARN